MTKDNPYLSDPDNVLMKEVGSGNLRAFRQLIEKYQKMVISTIYRYTGGHHQVEDLAQEIFLKVYQASKHYTPKAKFSTWLYKVVANHCFNYQRDQKKESLSTSFNTPLCEETIPLLSKTEGEIPSPDDYIKQHELRTALRKAIGELPQRQKMALLLFRYEELSYQEIAEVMGCSRSAVESLLFRAMTSLKEKLKPFLQQ